MPNVQVPAMIDRFNSDDHWMLDPKQVKPQYRPMMHVVDGVLLELRLQPARAEDVEYFVGELIKAQACRGEISVSIHGLGLDAYVHKATAIRLADYRRGEL